MAKKTDKKLTEIEDKYKVLNHIDDDDNNKDSDYEDLMWFYVILCDFMWFYVKYYKCNYL